MVANNCFEEMSACAESEVAELSLLVPAWQVDALEQAAHAEGITVAQLLRRVVTRTLVQLTPS